MKRPFLLLLYTAAVLGTFHLTVTTEFPPPPALEPTLESQQTNTVPFINCTDLGIPLKERYPDSQLVSRCPWDLKVFDNKVFVGCGDYDKNTGPTDIMYYDLEEKTWVNSGTVNDEAITKFLEFDNRLISPGTDPKSSHDFGNYYVFDPFGWITVSTVPDGVHMYDIEVFGNETFYAIGTPKKENTSPVQKTSDGKTFTSVPFLKDGKQLFENRSDTFARCFALFGSGDRLFAFARWYSDGYYGFFEYDGNAFNLCSENPLFETSGINRQTLLNEHDVLGEKSYFSVGAFYSTENFKEFTKIAVPCDAHVQDIVTKDGKVYVLTSLKQDSPESIQAPYKNTVWEYSEENGFKEILSFNHSTTAMSFDVSLGTVYVGLGSTTAPTKLNGTILEFNLITTYTEIQ